MKALLLAIVFEAVYLVAVTALLRGVAVRHRAPLMIRVFVATLPIYVAAYILSPTFELVDLEVSPEWLALGFGVLVYSAGFFGGTLQLYNLAERGFSLRLLTELDEAPEGLVLSELANRYSGGRGIRWMYQKRLDDLVDQGLIRIDNDLGTVHNTGRGERVAATFYALRRRLHLDAAAEPSPRC